tara:strand:+ start:1386 stop:2042 length:657 start_codon:yes stop_codon:yes gene_type:complete
MNDYLIFGASGLTGNHFLKQVKKEGQKYHLFVRSLISNEQESNQTTFSFENIKDLPPSKNLVICLGYPLNFKELIYMDKKTKDAFRYVDLELVIEIAKKAKDLGIPNIAIISAVGSKFNSLNFYLDTKARMENEILSLGFNKTFFAKPGHLLGPRHESRIDNWVRVIEFFGKIFGCFFIGPLKKYKNIEASIVAEELFKEINENNPSSIDLIEIHERK